MDKNEHMENKLIDSKRVVLKNQTDSDYNYMRLIYDEGDIISNYAKDDAFVEELCQNMWKVEHTPSNINVMIFIQPNDIFAGRIIITDDDDDDFPEIGVDILKKHQEQGIGTEALTLFLEWYRKNYTTKTLKVRINKDNKRSQHVFEKLGAELIGDTSYFPETMLENMEKETDLDIEVLKEFRPLLYHLSL